MRDSSRYGHELEQGSAMSELPSRADIIGRVLRVLKVPISNIGDLHTDNTIASKACPKVVVAKVH